MRLLVTGSAGHLGEALIRTLRDSRHEVVGLDVLDSPYTTRVGSITDRRLVGRCMAGVRAVFHAATLHKPHVATHSRRTSSTLMSRARSTCWRRQRRRASTRSSSRARPASSATPSPRPREPRPPG